MASRSEHGAPIVFKNATVLVLDGRTPAQEALAVHEGRILAVGSLATVRTAAGHGAREVDLAGATVMPGLIDTHPHLLHFAAREHGLVDLSDACNHADIVARIAAAAARTPKGDWIVTTPVGEAHYFIRRSWRDLEERRLPDRHVLDRASGAHPVHIPAWAPTTPNVCAFNTAGLAKIGISTVIPERVCDVWIEKDDDGAPSGIFRGNVNNSYCFDPFWIQILRSLPGPETWEMHRSVMAAMNGYNRQGVTAIYEAHNMRPAHIGAYRRLRDEHALTVRVMAAMEAESFAYPAPYHPLSIEGFRDYLHAGLTLMSSDDPMLRVSGMSFSPAAPLGPGTIRMHEPYLDPWGRPTRGMDFLSGDKQATFIDFCAAHDIRANFVVAGYRDTDDLLAALDEVADDLDVRARGWLVQHAILITEAQARRLRDYGFDMTTSMGFSWGKADVYGERAGTSVWRDQVPLKRLLRLGLSVGCGSDWGPKNAWENIRLAETHEFAASGHRNDTPDHKLTREESLLTWTRDAARVIGWERMGTLAAGNHADLIVVDRDPMTCDLDALPDTRVHFAMVAGRAVHDEGVF